MGKHLADRDPPRRVHTLTMDVLSVVDMQEGLLEGDPKHDLAGESRL